MISSENLVTGGQLRAARALAGLTQKSFAYAVGVDERTVRFWERYVSRPPTTAPNDARIEEVLLCFGVIVFADPTPGVRLIGNNFNGMSPTDR